MAATGLPVTARETCAARGYHLTDHIGSGSFSSVYSAVCEAKDGSQQDVAVKVINKANISLKKRNINIEVAIMEHVEHAGIVRLLDKFEDSDRVYLIMEQMKGGELLTRLLREYPHGYTEAEAAFMVRMIVEAVEYIHSQGVVHRDLKPENLLFAESSTLQLKLADFGLAQIYQEDMLFQTACGSPHYVAPEILKGKGYTFSVDMWSVGCVTYVMLCGFCPFVAETDAGLFQRICDGRYTFPSPFWDGVSEDAKDFIRKCLIVNPDERITPAEGLEHPFLRRPVEGAAAGETLAGVHERLERTVHGSKHQQGHVVSPPSAAPGGRDAADEEENAFTTFAEDD
eukprot:TRINITY_DN47462_c0_g1_i1.p1 TRINITY_DN47462_c0_g1~~TRINITY_DN47462_c0_g1_i1.p1  ORF type:complete len:342 (+),score=134.50 TRINITY_DN47462_c0_g1_i1:82-1107(+)